MPELLSQQEAIDLRKEFLQSRNNFSGPSIAVSTLNETNAAEDLSDVPMSQNEVLERRKRILDDRKALKSSESFEPDLSKNVNLEPLQKGLSNQELVQAPIPEPLTKQFQVTGESPISRVNLFPETKKSTDLTQAAQVAFEPQKRETSIKAQEPVTIRASSPIEMLEPIQRLSASEQVESQISLIPIEEREQIKKSLATSPQNLSELGLFKGKASELGKKIGLPFFGGIIEDIANPASIPQIALADTLLFNPVTKKLAGKLISTTINASRGIAPALETSIKGIEKISSKIFFDMNEIPKVEPENFPIRNIEERARTALRAIAPGISYEDAINSIVASTEKRNAISGLPVFDDAKNKIIRLIGSGNRNATNQAIDILRNVVSDKVFNKIKNINPDADVGLVMERLATRFSSNITEKQFTNSISAKSRDDNFRLISKTLESPRSGKLWKFIREMMKDDLSLEDLSKVKRLEKTGSINPELEKLSQEGSFKDISAFQSMSLDLERISNAVDNTGTVFKTMFRPLVESDIKYREVSQEFRKDFIERFPDFKPNSEKSSVLQRLIENRANPEDVKLIDKNMKRMSSELRNVYSEFLVKVNETRTRIGKAPIPIRKDYTTHFNELGVLEDFFGSMSNIPNDLVMSGSEFAKPNSPFFASALQRLGGKFKDDAIGGLFRYVEGSNRVIFTTDPILNVRLNSRFLPVRASDTFNKFANAVAGKNPANFVLDEILTVPVLGKFLKFSNRQFVNNIIIGNVGPVISQSQSLPFIAYQTGLKNLFLGMADLIDPAKEAFAVKNSLGVRTRFLETDWNPSNLNAVQNFMNALLSGVDTSISKIAFNAGLRKAAESGLTGESAINFAEKVVNRSNFIYSKANTPIVLQNKIIKLVFPIQTMTFNSMNFLKEDIAKGLMNNPNKAEEIKKVADFLGTAFAINAVAYGTALILDKNIRNVFSWNDFIPFFRMARTDYRGQLNIPIGAFEAPVQIGMGIGGLFSDTTFERKEAGKKILSGISTLILPGGGTQIKRGLRGEIFPLEKGKLKKTGTEAITRVLGF